jgi:ATP-dependent Lhr-like helicase
MQRIGLSATVGDPQSLLEWLAGHCAGERQLVSISAPPADVDLSIDYVGNLENAATVIGQLHSGEKRLVFCDSRSRVEELAQGLRARGVDTVVSHAALAVDTRRQAEQAFAERQNCVIVATSTLELGLDVGDLDRVIQIDAPASVASFLQRLGRTGRREDLRRNTLFLATTDTGLLESAALIYLFRSGYVEPVVAPPSPYHILVQQLLSSILQANNQLPRGQFEETLRRVPEFGRLINEAWSFIASHLEHETWIYAEEASISLGARAEKRFSGKGLADLCVSFESTKTFTVLLGDKHLGDIDPISFRDQSKGPRVISLGGRPWKISTVDWKKERVYVEPSEEHGRTQWLGNSRGISARVAGAVRVVIEDPEVVNDLLSQRARKRITELSEEMQWTLSENPVRTQEGIWTWWTYAGSAQNRLLVAKIHAAGGRRKSEDGYCVAFDISEETSANVGWDSIRNIPLGVLELPMLPFKFDELLPDETRTLWSSARAQHAAR